MTSLKQFGLNRVLTVEPTDPKETAQKIVAGAVARTKDVYFPYLQTRLTPLIREFFPDVFDFYIRYLYTKSWQCKHYKNDDVLLSNKAAEEYVKMATLQDYNHPGLGMKTDCKM